MAEPRQSEPLADLLPAGAKALSPAARSWVPWLRALIERGERAAQKVAGRGEALPRPAGSDANTRMSHPHDTPRPAAEQA
jgi:hypothetical protein